MTEKKSEQSGRGGAAKPEDTRKYLIQAGLKLFGQDGFKNVTTRALATEAGVNQAAIPYHFGGKEGLYIAVAGSVVAQFSSLFDQAASIVTVQLDQAESGVEGAMAALDTVYRVFFIKALRNAQFSELPMFVLREYQSPGPAFDVLYEGALSRMHRLITSIVSSALGLPHEAHEAKLRAQVLLGQMFSFIAARQVLYRRVGWDGYTDENAAEVVEILTDMGVKALGLTPKSEGEKS